MRSPQSHKLLVLPLSEDFEQYRRQNKFGSASDGGANLCLNKVIDSQVTQSNHIHGRCTSSYTWRKGYVDFDWPVTHTRAQSFRLGKQNDLQCTETKITNGYCVHSLNDMPTNQFVSTRTCSLTRLAIFADGPKVWTFRGTESTCLMHGSPMLSAKVPSPLLTHSSPSLTGSAASTSASTSSTAWCIACAALASLCCAFLTSAGFNLCHREKPPTVGGGTRFMKRKRDGGGGAVTVRKH